MNHPTPTLEEKELPTTERICAECGRKLLPQDSRLAPQCSRKDCPSTPTQESNQPSEGWEKSLSKLLEQTHTTIEVPKWGKCLAILDILVYQNQISEYLSSLLATARREERGKIGEEIEKILKWKDQPCENYAPNKDMEESRSGDPYIHSCPDCESEKYGRAFFGNCHADHHKGGWTKCGLRKLLKLLTQKKGNV